MEPSSSRVNPALVIVPLVVIIALIGVAVVLLVRSAQTSSKNARQVTRQLSRRAPAPQRSPTIALLANQATDACERADRALVWIQVRGGANVTVETATGRQLPARARPTWCSDSDAVRVGDDGGVTWRDPSGAWRPLARPSPTGPR